MRPRTLFLLSLTAFLLLYVYYGLNRFTLGVDFTDEGAYLSWPLRLLFGEKPFTSELTTLLRPIEVYFTLPFQLHPAIRLYEFRLLGWSVHLLSFSVLSFYLFRLSAAPLQSPLLASIPFFVCHIFGLASPSYNTLSSDFFLVALSLFGLAALGDRDAKNQTLLHLAAGLALFIATFAHPALGLVAAVFLTREFLRRRLAQNLLRRRLTPSNAGVLLFVACWLAFLLRSAASGALSAWWQRIVFTRSFAATALHDSPFRFFYELAGYPFFYSHLAAGTSLAALAALCALRGFSRASRPAPAACAAGVLALVVVLSLIFTFTYEPEFLPVCFAFACLVLLATHSLALAAPLLPAAPGLRFLLLMSGLGAVLCATTTFYFSPLRSWVSGILALPFAFSAGLALLLKTKPALPAVLRVLVIAASFLAVACVAREHWRFIQRDAAPASLVATFHSPKLRHIRSTEERVRAVDALCDYLHPRLARGEPLLAYNDCPMLYYLFDAMPAYGLTWAVSYGVSPAVLQRLDAEFRSRPLPHYAIRTLVDLSNPVWAIAPRTRYDNSPLNQTVTTHYKLERTIFPFEIWRLKTATP